MRPITQQTVNKLVTGKPAAKILWDGGTGAVRGFGVRLTEAGTVTFVLDYYFRGKKRRYRIGRHPEYTADDARKEAMALKVDITNGHDPLAERHEWKSDPTLASLADSWLKDAEGRKRESSLRDDRRMLTKIILPEIGERRLDEITEKQIVKLHESLRSTPYQGNRCLALVSSIFNYGIEQKLIDSNPAKGIKKFKENKRERWLTVEELQKFREALDKYKNQSAANVVRLLILTGSRASEVLKARWEEFDLQRGLWTKPSHHTKQNKVEHVPLSAPALNLLESMSPENPTGPLFPGTKRTGKNGTRTGGSARVALRRPWIAACRAAGLVEEYFISGKRKDKDGNLVRLKRYRPTVRVHDLRHNFASHLASNGVSLQVVGKLLGHTQASTTMRYAHLQDAPLRDAANQFGRIFIEKPKAGKRRA
jgi:integrase